MENTENPIRAFREKQLAGRGVSQPRNNQRCVKSSPDEKSQSLKKDLQVGEREDGLSSRLYPIDNGRAIHRGENVRKVLVAGALGKKKKKKKKKKENRGGKDLHKEGEILRLRLRGALSSPKKRLRKGRMTRKVSWDFDMTMLPRESGLDLQKKEPA